MGINMFKESSFWPKMSKHEHFYWMGFRWYCKILFICWFQEKHWSFFKPSLQNRYQKFLQCTCLQFKNTSLYLTIWTEYLPSLENGYFNNHNLLKNMSFSLLFTEISCYIAIKELSSFRALADINTFTKYQKSKELDALPFLFQKNCYMYF